MRHICSLVGTGFIMALLMSALVQGTISPVLAQPSISVSAGLNGPYDFSSLREEELFGDRWPVGFGVGAMAQIPLTRWMLLDPALTYRLYLFHEAQDFVSIGDKFISSSGEPIQELFLGLGLRLHAANDTVALSPFAEVTGGFEFQHVGSVTLLWQQNDKIQYTTHRRPIDERGWAFTVGIGILIRLSSRFSLQPSIHWHGNGMYGNYSLATMDLTYAVVL